MVLLVEMNGSRHELNSSATTSRDSHYGMANLSTPEPEMKSNGAQIEDTKKTHGTQTQEDIKRTNGSQMEEDIKKTNGSQVEADIKKINGSQTEENIKMPTSTNGSSVNAGSVETVNADNKASTGRHLMEDTNTNGAEQGGSNTNGGSKEGLHAATVENTEGLEADADSSFELFRDGDELADEYSYDYDDYVNESMWGDEEWTEDKHEKLEDYVNIDSHILCTPVSSHFTFLFMCDLLILLI